MSRMISMIELVSRKNTKTNTNNTLLLGDQILELEFVLRRRRAYCQERLLPLNWEEQVEYFNSNALKSFFF